MNNYTSEDFKEAKSGIISIAKNESIAHTLYGDSSYLGSLKSLARSGQHSLKAILKIRDINGCQAELAWHEVNKDRLYIVSLITEKGKTRPKTILRMRDILKDIAQIKGLEKITTNTHIDRRYMERFGWEYNGQRRGSQLVPHYPYRKFILHVDKE
jgi:hypothetical protein